jgi:hypothetical protein
MAQLLNRSENRTISQAKRAIMERLIPQEGPQRKVQSPKRGHSRIQSSKRGISETLPRGAIAESPILQEGPQWKVHSPRRGHSGKRKGHRLFWL